MTKVVSITSQGQLSIPKQMLKSLGIQGGTKAVIRQEGTKLIVEPQHSFWSLAGSLSSSVKLTDKELKSAREAFGKQVAKEWT